MSKMTIQQAAKILGPRFKPSPGTKLVGGKWVTLYTLDGKVVTAAEVLAATKGIKMASRAQRYRAKQQLSLAAPDPQALASKLSTPIKLAQQAYDAAKRLEAEVKASGAESDVISNFRRCIKMLSQATSSLEDVADGIMDLIDD